MIPQQLKITNFLSYRETQILNFDEIELACIAGQNGAGKSSILEAITWSLFGKGRSRSDDDIVNRIAANNGDRAEVQLTFELEGVQYRVMRRKRVGKPLRLEFQLRQEDGQWRTLSESSVRATQQTIERTLNMGYDTFINISFFLQGQADEFTTKSPARRKEILAELLDIAQWDELKERAAEARKASENELALLDHRLTDIDEELTQQEEREAALEAARANEQKVQAQLEQQTQMLQTLRRAAEAAQRQQKEVTRINEQLERERERLQALEQRQQRQQQQLESQRQLLARRDEIESNHKRFEKLSQAIEQWQAKAEQYNALQTQMRPHEVAIERAESSLQQRQRELNRQRERVEKMATERASVSQEATRLGERLADLRQQLDVVEQREQEYRQIRDRLQAQQAQRRLWQQEAEGLRKQAGEIARAHNERERIEASLTADRLKLEQFGQAAERVAEQRARLTELRTEHKVLLTGEKPRLKEMMDKLRARLDRLSEETGDICPLCGQPLSEAHRERVMADIEREGKQLADDYRYNNQRIAELSSEMRQLELRLNGGSDVQPQIEKQRQLVAQQQARLEELARIETAWQAGENEQRLTELEQLLADDEQLRDDQRRAEKLAQQVAEKKSIEQQHVDTQRRLSSAEARLDEIERTQSEWQQNGQPALADVSERLRSKDYEQEARSQLAKLLQQAAQIGYDQAKHYQAREERQALSDAPDQYQKLVSAQAAVQPLEESIKDNRQQIEQQQQQIGETQERLEEARALQQAYQADAAELQPVEESVQQLREQQVEANRKVGVAQQRVLVLDDQRQKRAELLEAREALTMRIGRLQLLERSCSRDGVQALLIEHALPEIEDRANELLDRLTNGEMRVSFDTQRKLKTSDAVRETLDISIVDRSGERPYENYSGGEQFRINFAIRLALSQMLSRRAGARLQTLVIDEGFGSQDPNGRWRLVEAINEIQDDFERILVITHIEELRDAFPTRIEVRKTSQGSQIETIAA